MSSGAWKLMSLSDTTACPICKWQQQNYGQKEPKELVPWLEELLVLTKKLERSTHLRVEAGAIRPMILNHAIRHRLALEAALWKVKNGK